MPYFSHSSVGEAAAPQTSSSLWLDAHPRRREGHGARETAWRKEQRSRDEQLVPPATYTA